MHYRSSFYLFTLEVRNSLVAFTCVEIMFFLFIFDQLFFVRKSKRISILKRKKCEAKVLFKIRIIVVTAVLILFSSCFISMNRETR